jgi:hypothetical protein
MNKFYDFLLNKINNYKELDLQTKGTISLKTRLLIEIYKGMITPTFPEHFINL